MNNKVMIGHGSGGKLTRKLIQEVFLKHLSNSYLNEEDDSAVVSLASGKVVFSTDAFTVKPLFFPGGDIGKLAVCGTVNDLVVSGANPKFLSASFVIEEGFSLQVLENIVISFAEQCKKANVELVAADTKVVEKGEADGIFISVSGIGELQPELSLSAKRVESGDSILISGDIGDHGAAILLARDELNIQADIQSDCACLDELVRSCTQAFPQAIKLMRDATRGGVATIINELIAPAGMDATLFENCLPIKPQVQVLCEMLGLNPLYLANEGKIVMIVEQAKTEEILSILRQHPLGSNAQKIGEINDVPNGRLYLETLTRGTRILDSLIEDQLPRIC